MQISRAFAFLCLVVSVGAQKNHRLICYPDALTPRTREGSCTHLILPPVSSDDDLHLQSLTEDDSYILKNMKERNPTLKILFGLKIKSSRLELMSASEAGVGNFIETLLTYLDEKSLDGLDVIWLDAATFDASTGKADLFPNFLKSLKGAFEEETNPLLLSVSVLEPTNQTAASYDETTLSQYVDFISILPAHLEMDGQYFNTTAQHWQDQQVDLQKLNLAMPAFLQRSHRGHHHINPPRHFGVIEEEAKKDHFHVLNSFFGDQVCQAVKSGQEQFITLRTFSDEKSPVKEVLQKGFGGIGVVFIDLDVFGNLMCINMIQKEMTIVESKLFTYSRHGHRRHGHRGLHHHHSSHDTGHHDHGHRERRRHHHGHRHHHRGHHHHGHHHHHHDHSTTAQTN